MFCRRGLDVLRFPIQRLEDLRRRRSTSPSGRRTRLAVVPIDMVGAHRASGCTYVKFVFATSTDSGFCVTSSVAASPCIAPASRRRSSGPCLSSGCRPRPGRCRSDRRLRRMRGLPSRRRPIRRPIRRPRPRKNQRAAARTGGRHHPKDHFSGAGSGHDRLQTSRSRSERRARRILAVGARVEGKPPARSDAGHRHAFANDARPSPQRLDSAAFDRRWRREVRRWRESNAGRDSAGPLESRAGSVRWPRPRRPVPPSVPARSSPCGPKSSDGNSVPAPLASTPTTL